MNKSIVILDTAIQQDADGRYRLNDIHQAAISSGFADSSQRPGNFTRTSEAKSFIAVVNTDAHIRAVETIRGGALQGTYATELVALRYAGWIKPEMEVEVYRTFQKYLNADEGLAHDLIERQKDPNASKRLAVRAQGKVSRLGFTDTLKSHGVKGVGYAQCTNAIYQPLFGGKASDIKTNRNLSAKANLREHMSGMELAATMFAEEVASDRIKRANAKGNRECEKQTKSAASDVKSVMDKGV